MIYLLEDDDSIRKLVIYALESQGFKAMGFALPSDFYKALEQLPELIILDIMLPEEDGISILTKLRKNSQTKDIPIIMLTAKNTEYDRVVGLDSGADDYISKPFGTMELVARVRAMLRRMKNHHAVKEYSIGKLYICIERHEVLVNQEPVVLTYKEFKLLTLLVKNQGIVMTRDVLMDEVWGLEAERENRTLDVHIRTLRMKLKEAGAYIETVRSVGYRLSGDIE